MTKFESAANLSFFLLERQGSVCAVWRGRMLAAEQRALFGRFLGKGLLVVDGENERLSHVVGRCFGLDFEITADLSWRDL